MKKIYAKLERLICISVIILLSIIEIIMFSKFHNTYLVIISFICIAFIVIALLKISYLASRIVITNNIINVFEFPLFATNKFYDKKASLILYNNTININEVEKIELIKLTKEEQKNYIGYKHLYKKCLKFNLKQGNPKYVYVGNYSNNQIKKLISLV